MFDGKDLESRQIGKNSTSFSFSVGEARAVATTRGERLQVTLVGRSDKPMLCSSPLSYSLKGNFTFM